MQVLTYLLEKLTHIYLKYTKLLKVKQKKGHLFFRCPQCNFIYSFYLTLLAAFCSCNFLAESISN